MRALLTAVLVATVLAQADQVATPIWTVTEGVDAPESVYFDEASGFLFSSQIGGDASARDGNGRIAKLTLGGKLVDANWAKGLNAPKGLRAYQGTLFVADIDEVVGFDIKTGRETSRLRIADAKFLNDLCAGPDGAIYTSDSFQNRIYVVHNGVASVFLESPRLELPNGVLVNGNRLIVATDGAPAKNAPAALFAIDFTTKALTQITTQSIGTPDGVESDGRGGFIVSDVARGGLYRVNANGESRQIRQLGRQPADIAFIPGRNLLIVPHTGLNRVSAYELTLE
jgi:sugar lactone lactonase YvrE